jgi:hypothetical protein
VNHNYHGPNGEGFVLCDVSLWAAPASAWTVHSLTFFAAGSGNHASAFSEVSLHRDTGNGLWDGPVVDPPATVGLAGFTGGEATFNLAGSVIAAGTTRRMFVVGKFGGNASSGETFRAGLDRVTATPAASGAIIVGIPTGAAAALVIDAPALTASNGPNRPAPITHKAGVAGVYTVAQFRLAPVNEPVAVNGVVLTTGGGGDWTTDVDPAGGVQVYADNGDGMFGAADALLFQGAGAPVIVAPFAPPLIVQPLVPRDLWVVVELTPSAGFGAIDAPDTFTIGIQSPADVLATSVVVLGPPVPSGTTLGAIEFAVTDFAPRDAAPGEPISIRGKGFVMPFEAKINGVVCPGTPVIVDGRNVEGLQVPPGQGAGLAIEITSGNLPTQALAFTFTYSDSQQSSDSMDEEGSCRVGASGAFAWAVVFALVLLHLRKPLAGRRLG